MKKIYLFCISLCFIEFIILVLNMYAFLSVLFLFIVNLLFYFFYIKRKEIRKEKLNRCYDLVNRFSLAFKADKNIISAFTFAKEALLLEEIKEIDLLVNVDEKIAYLTQKYPFRPIVLLNELLNLNVSKTYRLNALEWLKKYIIYLNGNDNFDLKNIFSYLLQMNCLLILIKFIINLKNNYFIDFFSVIIYGIETIFIIYYLVDYYKVNNDYKVFIYEYLIKINYQTPYSSYENSLIVLDKKYNSEFFSILKCLTNQEYKEIYLLEKKYNNKLISYFFDYVFSLNINNNFQIKNNYFALENELTIKENKNYIQVIDYLFCFIVLILIYYLLNNYGKI